jgi:hypothetical protein
MVPAFRNLSINPCFEKPIKLNETSPRDHFLGIIDELSKLTLQPQAEDFLPCSPNPTTTPSTASNGSIKGRHCPRH